MDAKLTSVDVDKAYLFMTVTHYVTGRVVGITPTDFVLNDAAWIPDTGRMNECISKGSIAECEPLGDGIVVNRSTVALAVPWRHKLPKTVK